MNTRQNTKLLTLAVCLAATSFAGAQQPATSVPPHVITDAAVIRGTIVHTYRFRTTGRGTAAFHSIGRFLRQWGIDEWPSFWNVLRGEMRVVDMSIWNCRNY